MKKFMLFFFITLCSFFVIPNVYADEIGRVVGDFIGVRKSSSSLAPKLATVIYGTKVNIISEDEDYYKVVYDGLNTGYIHKDYVLKESEYTLDNPTYCEYLMKLGFDKTYCPYLSYIHKLHPKWTFTPLKTNVAFFDAVNEEEGKNTINSKIDAYRSSDKEVEKGWYPVNQSVNAYMLDPRNFLLEKTLFMFENLNYHKEVQTATVVGSIFGSSYLNDPTYIGYYMKAGATYNISPVHLASRTVQEGGSKSTYGAVSGTYTGTYDGKSLKGFYNYYNIGAYKDAKTSNPMLRGIAYAAGYVGGNGTSYNRPWTSRELAIMGGANFLSNSYIGKGQNTIYLEKFNVNPESSNSMYTHQYMSNIMAPYEEGLNTKKSYEKMGVLDDAFNFVIPVFNDMPAYTEQATLLSGDNILGGIYIDGTLIEGFDADINQYTLYKLNDVAKVNITAISNSADVTLEGVGEVELTEEKNVITITVTAENGDVNKYTITIIKVIDSTTAEEIVEKMSVKNKGNCIYGISPGTGVATLIKSVEKISPNAKTIVFDSTGKIVVNGILGTGYKITIKTFTSTKSYHIGITGDINGDGKATIQDLLRLQKHLLGSIKLSGINALAADLNFNGSLNIQDLLRLQKYLLGSVKL